MSSFRNTSKCCESVIQVGVMSDEEDQQIPTFSV